MILACEMLSNVGQYFAIAGYGLKRGFFKIEIGSAYRNQPGNGDKGENKAQMFSYFCSFEAEWFFMYHHLSGPEEPVENRMFNRV